MRGSGNEPFEEFADRHGIEEMERLLSNAGHHSTETGFLSASSEDAPQKRGERLIFALAEALDYGCYQYGCTELSKEEIEQFLRDHREMLDDVPPSSMLGAISGQFDGVIENGAE